MRLNSKWLFGLLTVTSIVAIVACEGIPIQDPARIFTDGKWPEIMRKLNGQLLELRNPDQIVARVQQDQTRKDLLRVAVIDCGVDYTNPDLVGQIAFDVDGGKVTGAGYDVMGKDNTPSPQILDPSLFAFGAEAIVDDKIQGAPANPLDILLKIDQDFQATLKAKIMADPDLANSFYAKFLNGSINIIGAYGQITGQDLDAFIKDQLEGIAKSPSDYDLFNPRTPPTTDPSKTSKADIIKARHSLAAWVLMAKFDPALDVSTGLPMDMPGLFLFEHFDKFAKVLKESFQEVDQRQHFTEKYQNYTKFLTAWSADSSVHTISLTNLAKALAFKKYGPSILDPIRDWNLNLRAEVVTETLLKGDVNDWSRFSFNQDNVGQALDNVINGYQQSLQGFLDNGQLAFGDKIKVKSELDALPQLRVLKDWYLKNRAWEKTNLADDSTRPERTSLYRQFLYRTAHPFLSHESATTSHGSHVSGIIAKQNPNIRIYPIRVLTQTADLPESQKKALADEVSKQLTTWLQDPLVFKAMSDYLKPIADMVGSADLKSTDKAVFAKAAVDLFADTLMAQIDSDPLNFLFPYDIIEAVKKVGEQKIKIANVSLGTEFQAPVSNPDEKDPQKILEDHFKFIQFEFLKYQLGVAIRRYAPQTVFVVANGNSGHWVDGRSQSAMPVDLSSPFLEKYQDAASGLVAPNNQIDNVIGVGSLDPSGQISSYTNLIISKKTPFVMAEGESVLSTVRVTDASPVNEIVQSYLPKFSQIGTYYQPVSLETAERDALSEALEKNIQFSSKQKVIKSLADAISMQMVVMYSDHRALMSGTSMASPTVAGLIGDDMIKQAVASGLDPDKLYDARGYTAHELIARTLSRAKVMEGDLYIPLKALRGEIRPTPGASIAELEQKLNLLKIGDPSGFLPSAAAKTPTRVAPVRCEDVMSVN